MEIPNIYEAPGCQEVIVSHRTPISVSGTDYDRHPDVESFCGYLDHPFRYISEALGYISEALAWSEGCDLICGDR